MISIAQKVIIQTWTSPLNKDTQRCISAAIKDGVFGNPLENKVSQIILLNLDMFSDSDAQVNISQAICDRVFGTIIEDSIVDSNV